MKNNRSKQRRGFTLVELLIVIVVIGVLSAMMMLSSTEAVSSARASNIVSNLRNLKTAATAMYVDHQDTANKLSATEVKYHSGTESGTATSMDVVVSYMNSGASTAGTTDASLINYGIVNNATNGWFVFIDGVTDLKVQEKLAGRAKSVGLLSTTNTSSNYVAGTNGTGNQKIYMFVLKP